MKYREFKVGNIVKCISNSVENESCINKIGKIIHMDKDYPQPYTVTFFESTLNESGPNDCWGNFYEDEIQLYISILKLFLKGKQNE